MREKKRTLCLERQSVLFCCALIRLLGVGDVNQDTVDLHLLVGGDEEKFAAVDDPGFHHVAVFLSLIHI